MFWGCSAGAPQARGPGETLQAYAAALEASRVEEAYSMLSDEARREISLDAFRRMVRESPQEVLEISRALQRPTSPPLVTATISSPSGETLVLIYEGGRWKVDSSAVDLYAQNTPRQAVTAFVRAFERQRFDVLMRFVPEAKRPGLDAKKLQESWSGNSKEAQDLQRRVQAVKSAIASAAVEEVGDRATMPFGAAGTVQLVREHGLWRIEELK